MTVATLPRVNFEGTVAPGFEGVRTAFLDNFTRHGELGGACSVYHRGRLVVDLWGGDRSRETRQPWERDTMAIVWSASKGLAAMTLAIAHARGWLDYDERISTYWPEFAQHGKDRITVRQLLAHQAGLFAFDEPVDPRLFADLDRLAVVLARQRPAWEPGTRQAYHALTLGFYEGEIIRRVDPKHRSLSQVFRDEIATPLCLDVYLRLPQAIPNARLATLAAPGFFEMAKGLPPRLVLDSLNRRSVVYRAIVSNPGTRFMLDEEHVYLRDVEVPSGNAVGTARGIAHAYGIFASGGKALGLTRSTLDLLEAPAVPPASGVFHDEFFRADVRFSLGFMKPGPVLAFGRNDRAYGSPGAGGAFAFADPTVGLGYAYLTSQMGTQLTGDARDIALRNAVYAALEQHA
jgi:CubicO group peptidase (beta-lactamase class C family)